MLRALPATLARLLPAPRALPAHRPRSTFASAAAMAPSTVFIGGNSAGYFARELAGLGATDILSGLTIVTDEPVRGMRRARVANRSQIARARIRRHCRSCVFV